MTLDDVEIVPSGHALGAIIHGVDLSTPLDDATGEWIEAAFNEHSVLCFRDQALDPQQLIDFTTRFGKSQRNMLSKYAMPDYPDILLVSNILENGKHIGHPDAGCVWHSDMSTEKHPPRATVLYAKEIPVTEDGTVLGDTLFASAVAAYDSLSGTMKERIQGLRAIHDVTGRRRALGVGTQEDNALRAAKPLAVHPVSRTHPYTGRKAIYVNNGECVGIEGMAEDDALSLIDELATTVIRDEFTYRHRWQVGDVVIWDNCAAQHLATHDYELPLRRLMWRVTIGYTDVYE